MEAGTSANTQLCRMMSHGHLITREARNVGILLSRGYRTRKKKVKWVLSEPTSSICHTHSKRRSPNKPTREKSRYGAITLVLYIFISFSLWNPPVTGEALWMSSVASLQKGGEDTDRNIQRCKQLLRWASRMHNINAFVDSWNPMHYACVNKSSLCWE